MGRTASHITLEVALQTHPNVALIGEEIQAKRQTLSSITKSIADIIATRALQGKHYGCIILPEGLVDFLPDVAALISELNELMASSGGLGLPSNLSAHLTPASFGLFASLPAAIGQQLLLDRDDHGNVQVSKIESERLVSGLVETELGRRKALGTYKGNPSFVNHFLGYEGRCGLPSNFDANYCYSLGQTCAALLATGHSGYIATIQGLTGPAPEWRCGGQPLTSLMNMERRTGHDKPVIRKALVRLEDLPFQIFEQMREQSVEKNTNTTDSGTRDRSLVLTVRFCVALCQMEVSRQLSQPWAYSIRRPIQRDHQSHTRNGTATENCAQESRSSIEAVGSRSSPSLFNHTRVASTMLNCCIAIARART